MPREYYQEKLFPFQDKVLDLMEEIKSPFYLTGGTALSRCYLQHRYSDDLDFFLNADPNFKAYCNNVIDHFRRIHEWRLEVGTTADTFLRVFLEREGVFLKVDFVNDIEYRYGDIEECNIYYRVDNWRNILSNKLCSLSRRDVKDLVDVVFTSMKYEFRWEEIFEESRQKDLWVDPLEICKIIKEFPRELLSNVKWMYAPNMDKLYPALDQLHDDIFWGKENSLCCS